MRVLVTGGAGFLGSTLVDRLLAEGHAVDVVDDLSSGRLDNLADARADRSNDLSIHHLDVRQVELVEVLARREPEVVFHLAARRDADPVTDAEVTVLGTLRVLEGARRAGTPKVVFASSAAIYGPVEDKKLPIRESQPQKPVTPSAVAKKAAADYLAAYREQHGIEFTALALPTVYGPRAAAGAVAALVDAALAGGTAVVAGDGNQTRDLLFVDDAVDALVRAATRGSGLLVNVGTGRETSVLELCRIVADATGSELTTTEGEVPAGEPRRVVLDAGRARIHLGWSPWTSVEEGVAETLRARRR